MTIDRQTVKKIAMLAKIRVSEDEVKSFGQELGQIMKWIEQLQEVAILKEMPDTDVFKSGLPMRLDQVNDGGYPEKILANAPDKMHDFFCVPKVVE